MAKGAWLSALLPFLASCTVTSSENGGATREQDSDYAVQERLSRYARERLFYLAFDVTEVKDSALGRVFRAARFFHIRERKPKALHAKPVFVALGVHGDVYPLEPLYRITLEQSRSILATLLDISHYKVMGKADASTLAEALVPMFELPPFYQPNVKLSGAVHEGVDLVFFEDKFFTKVYCVFNFDVNGDLAAMEMKN